MGKCTHDSKWENVLATVNETNVLRIWEKCTRDSKWKEDAHRTVNAKSVLARVNTHFFTHDS